MKFIFTILGLAIASSSFAGDTIYKWTEGGKVYYSDQIPPHLKSEYSSYSKNSITLKKIVEKELNNDEVKVRNESAKLEEEEKQKADQLKRKNNALLATYNSVADIDKRANAELNQANKIIKEYSDTIAKLREQEKKLEGNKPETEEQRKKISQDISTAEAELSKNKQLYADIEKKYNEDKEKFIEITSKK